MPVIYQAGQPLLISCGLRVSQADYAVIDTYAREWCCTPAEAIRRLLRLGMQVQREEAEAGRGVQADGPQ